MKALRYLFFIPLILLASTLHAQQTEETSSRQGVYVEFFGSSSSFVSVNYDRFLSEKWAVRGGLGFSFDFSEEEFLTAATGQEIRNRDYIISLPVTVGRLFGNGKKFLELAPGATLMFVSEKFNITSRTNRLELIPGLYAGYRRQPVEGGFLFRAGINFTYHENEVVPLIGLSFGHAFKFQK